MNTIRSRFTKAYNIYPLAGRNGAERKCNKIKMHFFYHSFFREEVRLLKEELTEEYDADKQAALTHISQQKELEMMAARESWQRKVEDLLEQVKHLHQYLCAGWDPFVQRGS